MQLEAVVVALLLVSTATVWLLRSKNGHSNDSSGYILENEVKHVRLLPVKAAHAFTYNTLSFLVSLDTLERGDLDLGFGWLFGYGGLWWRLSGIRSAPYLTPDASNPQTIRQKLEMILKDRGFSYNDSGHRLGDSWMLTMPSYLGLEGINPLTVYFCYQPGGTLWLVVLEIHNTFGESHVHVLEIGKGEETPAPSFTHQWTFPRSFHVSPFNDRSGFYTVSVRCPSDAPPHLSNSSLVAPWPAIRVQLYTDSEKDSSKAGSLKIVALLRATSVTPLTSISLVSALARTPFTLLLSFTRISYHAWILHYVKRLDVFIRPEPKPVIRNFDKATISEPQEGGVRWQSEGLLEKYARQCVEAYLPLAVERTGIGITLSPGDPSIQPLTLAPSAMPEKEHLNIRYLSPRFFSILFLSPSASVAFALGSESEGIFSTSSQELFISLFSYVRSPDSSEIRSFRQWLRCLPILDLMQSKSLTIDGQHPLDTDSYAESILSPVVIFLSLGLAKLEERIFSLARARVVVGDEPWKQWERTADVISGHQPVRMRPIVGSVVQGE